MRSNTANQSPVAPPPVQTVPGNIAFIDEQHLWDLTGVSKFKYDPNYKMNV